MGTSWIKPNINQIDVSNKTRTHTLNSSICTEEEFDQTVTWNKNFKALKHIGRGAFGEVYLVKSMKDGQHYAMKVISKEKITDEKHLDHFKSEKAVLSTIKHPFLLDSVEAYESKSKYYIVMEYMGGGSLKSLLCK